MRNMTKAALGLAAAGLMAAVPAHAAYQLGDNVSLGMKFFSDLTFSDNDADTGFHLKRSYVTLKAKVDDRLKLRLTLDQRDEDQAGAKGGVFVKYAYVDMELDANTTARLGLLDTPYVGYDEDVMWGYRFVAPTFTDQWGAQTSADLGASVMGAVRDGQVQYHVSVLNGEGYGNQTNGDGFALAGRVNVEVGDRVQVGGFFHEEKGRGGVADYDPSREGLFAVYEDDRFRIAGQVLMADDNVAGQTFDTGRGYNVQGRLKLPKGDEAFAFGRYDRLDRKDTGNEESLFILGVSAKVGKALTLAPNIRRLDTNAAPGADQMLILNAQLDL